MVKDRQDPLKYIALGNIQFYNILQNAGIQILTCTYNKKSINPIDRDSINPIDRDSIPLPLKLFPIHWPQMQFHPPQIEYL